MVGKKTHEQQQRIIEERVNTKNAGDDFDEREDLDRTPEERAARRRGSDLRPREGGPVDPDDRNMVRGNNQESDHNKERSDD